MYVEVLHLLVVVCVVTGSSSTVEILDYSNAVLKNDLVELYGDYHDVAEWIEL